MAKQLIVQIGNLAQFCREIPAPARVRLNLTEKNGVRGQKYPIPTVDIRLDLYGVNQAGEIVWLHSSHETERINGNFFSQDGARIYELYPEVKNRVAAWLTARGYEVRSGGYAISQDIRPARGVFECAYFQKTDDGQIVIVDGGGDNETT